MAEKLEVTPSTMSDQTQKKTLLEVAILPPINPFPVMWRTRTPKPKIPPTIVMMYLDRRSGSNSVPHSQTTGPTAAVPQPASPRQWVMPNLVGSNLQAAQDQIQALTGNPIFITFSHDASGRSRSQVLDSNWNVCAQNVEPGAPFTADTRIDFGAVKLTEKCP